MQLLSPSLVFIHVLSCMESATSQTSYSEIFITSSRRFLRSIQLIIFYIKDNNKHANGLKCLHLMLSSRAAQHAVSFRWMEICRRDLACFPFYCFTPCSACSFTMTTRTDGSRVRKGVWARRKIEYFIAAFFTSG